MKCIPVPLILSMACTVLADDRFVLENMFLGRVVSTEGGSLKTVKIVNKRSGITFEPASVAEFRLRFSQGTDKPATQFTLTAADFKVVKVTPAGGSLLVAMENAAHSLGVEVRYELKPEDFYLHKRLTITSAKPLTLERIDVEAFDLADAYQPYTVRNITTGGNWSPGLGQPLYTSKSATFWGIEFPAADNQVKNGALDAGYLWGRELKAGQQYQTYAAVMGVADDPAFVSEAFFEYINQIRVRPLRMEVQYNTWFDMINAGDAAGGSSRTSELVYRDSVYHKIWREQNTQFPMCSIFNHEPKKTTTGESTDEFRRYLYMHLSRGTGFIELYIKPNVLQPGDWDVISEGLGWAEEIFPTFNRAHMHGGSPKAGEVYGYTAWNQTQGYITIHNPSTKAKSYSVKLDRAFGLLPGSGPFYISPPIEDSARDLPATCKFGDSLTFELKPREIRVINFTTRQKDWTKLKQLQKRSPERDENKK